ncbi:cation transporter [Asticcacaulis sp. DXS10W]|uniref:Cation transporter n=1 Tax=Asticcacaulis currens TaxID=2984210 RepID=A0ABT5IK26_9CAUL|nr:cation transporter [Asticcacaulis currens]MDC7696160.1 cation transporter [Asticcacaulis currens]
MTSTETDKSLRRAVLMVGAANLAYFFVELLVARKIGSVSLFADSIDFFEDAAVNVLIFVALAWSARNRARAGMVMAGILLLPALSLLWTAWQKFQHPMPPEPWLLSATGLGALVVNVSCAFLLTKFRDHKGSLTRAAFLSARNDAFANVAIMAAGALTLIWPTAWPDLVVGIGIAIMNADAAREIWQAAHEERKAAKA